MFTKSSLKWAKSLFRCAKCVYRHAKYVHRLAKDTVWGGETISFGMQNSIFWHAKQYLWTE